MNKVWFITGCSTGFGRALATEVLQKGYNVVVTARKTADIEELVNSYPDNAIAVKLDVTSKAEIDSAVAVAMQRFGRIDVLVNNAGILRDRVLVNMSEADWDAVIHVHLKGHFVPTRHAAAYWREQAKAGKTVKASIINTSSTSGLLGNVGQSNYGAAKSGIASFTLIIAEELGRYGVRANAIAPAARTRMTESTPGLSDHVVKPQDASVFDKWDPANISPLVAALAAEDCDVTGEVFFVQGGTVRRFQNWTMTSSLEKDDRWSPSELVAQLPSILQ